MMKCEKIEAGFLLQPGQFCWSLGLLGTLLLFTGAFIVPTASAHPAALPCTYTIPNEVIEVDGAGNYSQVQAGDTLCLPAGTRGPIKFLNLHGTANNPITIQNSGGTARITGTRFAIGISLSSSSNVHLTGSGVSSQCGAGYAPAEQACGIEIYQTLKGVIIFTEGNQAHNFEVDHLYIHHLSPQVNSRAIGIHPLERQTVSGFYAHHNYVSGTRGEGLYVGSEPHGKPLAQVGKLENVEVSYNLVEETGYDGIKIKVAVHNVKVHHNIVRNAGLRGVLHHESGIQLATSVGEIYNNFVATEHEGIAMGRPLDNPGTRYFNNIVVGSRSVGMLVVENNAQVYNNTVVRSGEIGIKAAGLDSQVFDNIIAGTAGLAMYGPATNFYNNFSGSISVVGFVNAANGDYHLLASSPAVNAGRDAGLFPPFDYDGLSRPQGLKTDLGAYEYVGPPSSPQTHYIFLPAVLTD